jgi:hypothetical protein
VLDGLAQLVDRDIVVDDQGCGGKSFKSQFQPASVHRQAGLADWLAQTVPSDEHGVPVVSTSSVVHCASVASVARPPLLQATASMTIPDAAHADRMTEP